MRRITILPKEIVTGLTQIPDSNTARDAEKTTDKTKLAQRVHDHLHEDTQAQPSRKTQGR